MNLSARARDLIHGLQGRLGASSYDVAWMARLPANDKDGSTRWPELVDWLLENQWLDGSWGSAIKYYHDRILCTLAAIIALKERGKNQETSQAIERGERYIWHNLHRLHYDPFELVGFELIFPSLIMSARSLNLDVPTHTCGYGRIRTEKLRLIPASLLYSPHMPTTFSLEFMGNSGDPDRMCEIQGPNGSIQNSPAATAYLALRADGNQKALQYLESVISLPTGIPPFYPFRIMEIAWVLEHLSYGGLSLNTLTETSIWNELQASVSEEGVTIDPTYHIIDGDTTAVTLHVLALGGYPVDPMVLHNFEKPDSRVFRTHQFERNISTSANVHALGALALMPDYPERWEVWDRVAAMLLAERVFDTYWVDKWHASPYYVTSHALLTLIDSRDTLLDELNASIEWLIHTQRDDGSWGYFDRGTAEETAYALLALLHHHHKTGAVDVEVLRKAAVFLLAAVEQPDYVHPALWIVKTLFVPQSIIEAAILAALILYQNTIGPISG